MKSGSEYWRRVEDLYHRAVERSGRERQTLLDQECAGDDELRREVEALLSGQKRGQNFLEEPVARLSAGIRLSNYEIVEHIGSGGMGDVYRARDTKLNRPVAIKFLSADLADASARRRFQREAQMASSLNHPHILTVHDTGDFEGREYLVTEFIDGGTLREWAQLEKRTWRQILNLLTGVADGLAAAHAAGILHRDIKPANILVTKSGYAKLADFGLAKLAETASELTRTITEDRTRPGIIVGTVAYMSPEHTAGSTLDARSDVFSFGVLLHELLGGRRPFNGATYTELIDAIVHATPDPLPEDVPLPLRMIVEKALEKDPAERYQSMRDLVVDLRRAARAKPQGVPQQLERTQSRRLPLKWIALTVVMGAAIAGLWLAGRSDTTPINPLANAKFIRLTDFEGTENDGAISPDGKFAVFRTDRDGQFDLFMTQMGTGRFVNLTNGKVNVLRGPVRSVGFSFDGSEIWLMGTQNVARLELMPIIGGPLRPFLSDRVVNIAWSPDGTRIVYHTFDRGDPTFIAERTGGNARQIFVNRGLDGHNHYPIFSQDGQWIYFVSGNWSTTEMDVWRIPANGGDAERLTHHNSNVMYTVPIADDTLLYVSPAEDGSGPWLWALDTRRKITRRVSFGLERYTSLSASSDGSRVVATVANPTANLWTVPILDRIVEETDVKRFTLPTVRALAPRFGGKSLFYLSSSGTGDGLWRYRDGQALEIWKGAEEALRDPPAVSGDGLRATVVLRREAKRRIHVISGDGAELQPIGESIDVRGAASWSPDGKWVVTGGNDSQGAGLFKIPVDGGEPVRIVSKPAFNPVWSPDGEVIVYAGPLSALWAPMLAVRPDGTPVELPEILLRTEGERYRFIPQRNALIYMQGSNPWQEFWLLDMITMKTRQLTRLNNRAAMRTLDITPDGKQIVFDRLRENSDIVLIDLASRQ